MAHIAQTIAARNIRAWIDREPTDVLVQHRHLVTTQTGGRKWVNDSLSLEQRVRIVPMRGTTELSTQRVTPDGRTVVPSLIFVFPPDGDVKVGDIILGSNGKHYEVVAENNVPSWRKSMEVIENG